MITKICECCGKEFNVKNYRKDSAKYCSKQCHDIDQKHKITVKCTYCGKEKEIPPSRIKENNFCDEVCYGKYVTAQTKIKYADTGGKKIKIDNRKRKTYKGTIPVVCVVCGKTYTVIPSKLETTKTCSVECQAIWQSQNRTGENAPSWQGGSVTLSCEYCGKQFEADRGAYNRGTVKYCSKECQAIAVFSQPEVRAKQIEVTKNKWLDPEYRKIMQASVLHTLSTYPRETSIEKMTRERLEENNINHIPQNIINNKFCVDFYLPDYNVIIEVLGDYFHANPLIYGDEKEGLKPLNDIQKKNVKGDKARFAYLRKCGYSVYGFWECDIRKDLDGLMESITELHCKDIKGVLYE